MIYRIEDTMPHVHMFSLWKNLRSGYFDAVRVHAAYMDILNARNDAYDYLRIFSRICEGTYSPEEVMAAGLIMTDALDGYFLNKGDGEEAKYLRINGVDIIFLTKTYQVLTGKSINGAEFYGNNGKLYSLRNAVIKRGSTAPTANPQKMSKLTPEQDEFTIFQD